MQPWGGHRAEPGFNGGVVSRGVAQPQRHGHAEGLVDRPRASKRSSTRPVAGYMTQAIAAQATFKRLTLRCWSSSTRQVCCLLPRLEPSRAGPVSLICPGATGRDNSRGGPRVGGNSDCTNALSGRATGSSVDGCWGP